MDLTQFPGFSQLANLGVAGLMGLMWFWERKLSGSREQQLDEAHARIMADHVQLDQLIAVVRSNSDAMSKLTATQEQLIRTIGGSK